MLDRPYLVGPGWWPIIDHYMEQARAIDPDCTVEVKEKYGTLRADIITNKDVDRDALYQIEQAMEDASETVCEICGGPGGLKNMQNWYLTLCPKCASLDALERRKVYEETAERYYRGSHTRHGEQQSREEVREKKLKDFLPTDDRQDMAKSLFGILPPDIEEKNNK